MWQKRLLNVLAMGLVGDGVLSLLQPRRESNLWKDGPKVCQQLMTYGAEHPGTTRAFGLIEIALGLWLGINSARRKREDAAESGSIEREDFKPSEQVTPTEEKLYRYAG